jgi:adenosylmethionine-8-amino-7-oxononanoate aminotransferase
LHLILFQAGRSLTLDPIMTKSLKERDQEVIWHPYTQHKNSQGPIPLTNGKGSLLFDEKGNSYIDAVSSWWVNIHGHSHPYIAEKVYEQAKRLEHVIFTGFTHEPAVELAERLLGLLPADLARVFYSDNGSTAVEVAIKMSIQYWKNRENGGDSQEQGQYPGHRRQTEARNKILAFKHAYHGDTFGAMSVSDRSIFTAAFQDYLFEVIFIETPTTDNIAGLRSVIRDQAGGMRFYEAAMLDQLLDEVKGAGIICIADEILTGFGRTGKLFAGEWLRQQADIICLSKALTGGAMALGATVATDKIFRAFLSEDRSKTLFHGHSFTANPLACSAALASLDLLLEEDCLRRISSLETQHRAFAEKIGSHPAVRNIRVLGTVIAFELNSGEDGYNNSIGALLMQQSLLNGIYLRPLGNTVYIMPPYCITENELEQVYRFLSEFVEKEFTDGAPRQQAP